PCSTTAIGLRPNHSLRLQATSHRPPDGIGSSAGSNRSATDFDSECQGWAGAVGTVNRGVTDETQRWLAAPFVALSASIYRPSLRGPNVWKGLGGRGSARAALPRLGRSLALPDISFC